MKNNLQLFGLQFFCGSLDEALRGITTRLFCADKKQLPFLICTPNPEQIVLAQHNAEFLQFLRQADLLLPDGAGILAAARFLNSTDVFTERIAGVDIVSGLLEFPELPGPILILGGKNYAGAMLPFGWTIESVEKSVLAGTRVVQWLEGYADTKQPTAAEEEKIRKVVETLQPKMIFVALGAPAQERFMNMHRDLFFDAQVRAVMAVGGAFDFLTGRVRRAPAILQEFGLEWLYRLVQEPWRWKRQLRLVEFMWIVVRTALLPRSKTR